MKLYTIRCKTSQQDLLSDLTFCSKFMNTLNNLLSIAGDELVLCFSQSGYLNYVLGSAQLQTWPHEGLIQLYVITKANAREEDVVDLVERWFKARREELP